MTVARDRPDVDPPPRPRVTSDLPLPGTAVPPLPPRTVRVGVLLGALALAAGGVAVALAAIDRAGLHRELLASARAADPEARTSLLRHGVALTITSAAVLTTVAMLALLAGLVVLRRRRPAARWVIGLAGLLTLAAVGIDQGLVTGGSTDVDRLAFLTQGGLTVLALAVLAAPASRAWLRRRG